MSPVLAELIDTTLKHFKSHKPEFESTDEYLYEAFPVQFLPFQVKSRKTEQIPKVKFFYHFQNGILWEGKRGNRKKYFKNLKGKAKYIIYTQ